MFFFHFLFLHTLNVLTEFLKVLFSGAVAFSFGPGCKHSEAFTVTKIVVQAIGSLTLFSNWIICRTSRASIMKYKLEIPLTYVQSASDLCH